MKSYINIYAVLLIPFLLFQGCSKDTLTGPAGQLPIVLVTSTIGNNGGIIETDNIKITIPGGAFQENSELKILTSIEENLFADNTMSDFFVLDGLPTEISKPINIKIKYNGTLTDSSFIAIGETNFIKSLNKNSTSFQLLSAKDSAGYLIATLPPLSGNALGKGESISSVNSDKLAINLGAIAGYVSYVSQQGHFKINFPSSVLTQTYDLADYLENAYSKIQAMGFSYSQRTKWPVEVTVKRLKSTVFGYSYNSVWGDNYGYMEFNFDKMDDQENLKVSAGHEFFHLVQSLYDARNRYSKAKFFTPHLWLDEASAVWAEEYFSSNSNYVSPIFTDNAYDILKGAKTGSITDEAASYGYGMASFIKYLTKKHDNSALVNVYENIYNGNDAFSALSKVLSVDVGYNWNSYLKSLYTFDLYKNDLFKSASMVATAAGKQHKFTIKSVSDTLQTYTSSLTDLSATMFSIKNEFAKLDSSANLQFTCKEWNFQLYKVSNSESKFIKSGKDSLTLEGFKKITDAGYQIVAVLYNDDFDTPYTTTKDYEMVIRVKTPPRKIKRILFIFRSGVTTKRGETTEYHSNYSQSGSVDNKNCNINGNTILCMQDTLMFGYLQVSTKIGITFDNIKSKTSIVGFSFEENTGGDITTFAGENVPFNSNPISPVQVTYSYQGDVSQYVTNYTMVGTYELISYDATDMHIYIKITYDE